MGFISILSCLNSCVTLPDENKDLEPDNVTSAYEWSGELEKFTINDKVGIKLDDRPYTGKAYAVFPSTVLRNTRWEFGVHLSFNPSSSNYARFYLASTSDVLTGKLKGYFVQIGGAKDDISVCIQTNDAYKALVTSKELMKNIEIPKVYVKVECDTNGYWTLYTRLESESEYTKYPPALNWAYTSSSYCGVCCYFTITRSRGFTFHHIRVSNGVENVTDPDNPNHPSDPDNPNTPDTPTYPSEIRGLLLFNEVMYDNTSNGIEYIEFYNPADATVTIPALKLLRYVPNAAGESVTKTTAILKPDDGEPPITVPAKSYVCFTKSAAKLIKKHPKTEKSTIIETSKFPQIANEGGYLAIKTDEIKSRLIDKCSYFDTMHTTGKKRNQGISLEKKSPEIDSAKNANWKSCKDATGGTPGMKNSQ